MELEEHIYQDDPKAGPEDVQTNPSDTHYFFVGNGHILGAVQICKSGAATAIGLLLMSPDAFGPKRRSLSMDPENGLAATQIDIVIDQNRYQPDSKQIESCWISHQGIPAAKAVWAGTPFVLTEIFYCPNRSEPRLIRQLQFVSLCDATQNITIETGLLQQSVSANITLGGRLESSLYLAYDLVREEDRLEVRLSVIEPPAVEAPALEFWNNLFQATFDAPVLDHLFQTSRTCLQNTISINGAVDASIWQYNLEWVRDHSMMALGLIMSGNYPLARIMLARLLTQFVSEEGDTVDSSRRRPHQEIELDQNGELLLAIKTYVDYTGDIEFVQQHWEKIERTTEFPLQRIFQQKESGLLHNQREFWERHALFGIKDGIEITYQMFVSMGLACAASLAGQLEKTKLCEKWAGESERIKHAMLSDPKFKLIEHGHFIKRRSVNGQVQSEVMVHPSVVLPPGVPMGEAPPHFLNPDSSITLPIAWEFIDTQGELARNSLFQIERLWNQRWSFGGYGRYHVSSELDSPGPWPFASMFIARAYFENGQDAKVWRILNWLNSLTGATSGSWYEFYGPRPCPPCPQVGITPWTWAEVLLFFVHHVFGVRPKKNKLTLRPKLLSGAEKMQASFAVQACRIHLVVKRMAEGEILSGLVNGEAVSYSIEKGMTFSLSDNQSYQVEIFQ